MFAHRCFLVVQRANLRMFHSMLDPNSSSFDEKVVSHLKDQVLKAHLKQLFDSGFAAQLQSISDLFHLPPAQHSSAISDQLLESRLRTDWVKFVNIVGIISTPPDRRNARPSSSSSPSTPPVSRQPTSSSSASPTAIDLTSGQPSEKLQTESETISALSVTMREKFVPWIAKHMDLFPHGFVVNTIRFAAEQQKMQCPWCRQDRACSQSSSGMSL
jgi:hypothetical protein